MKAPTTTFLKSKPQQPKSKLRWLTTGWPRNIIQTSIRKKAQRSNLRKSPRLMKYSQTRPRGSSMTWTIESTSRCQLMRRRTSIGTSTASEVRPTCPGPLRISTTTNGQATRLQTGTTPSTEMTSDRSTYIRREKMTKLMLCLQIKKGDGIWLLSTEDSFTSGS